eukprot:344680_1
MDATTITDLQDQLKAEREAKSAFQKAQELSLSTIDSLSTQLRSAKAQVNILCEEASLDQHTLQEMKEKMEQQQQHTLQVQAQINILRSLDNHHEDTKWDEQNNIEAQELIKYQKQIETLQQTLSDKEH